LPASEAGLWADRAKWGDSERDSGYSQAMAKPNYQFEKRQRDLAKKAKQEEKRRNKLAAKAAPAEAAPQPDTAPADGPVSDELRS
jgi:hypothetical protein